MLAEQAFRHGADFAEGWNFGPGGDSEQDVEALLTRFIEAWGQGARWTPDRCAHKHEANLLRLDTTKAREKLGWRPLLDFNEMVDWTARWYRAHARGADMRALTYDQIDAYLGQRVRLTSPFTAPALRGDEDRQDAAQRIA
jgi:CDP-glucose 4,6-dehydratase